MKVLLIGVIVALVGCASREPEVRWLSVGSALDTSGT